MKCHENWTFETDLELILLKGDLKKLDTWLVRRMAFDGDRDYRFSDCEIHYDSVKRSLEVCAENESCLGFWKNYFGLK